MKWLLPPAFIILSCVGCGGTDSGSSASDDSSAGQSVEQKLVGAWSGDVEISGSQGDSQLTDAQLTTLKSMKLDIEFKSDGTMVLSGNSNGQPYESRGRWEVLRHEGKKVVFRSTENDGPTKDLEIELEDATTFSMPLPAPITELGSMRFRKLR